MPKGIYVRSEEEKERLINLNKSLGHGFQKGNITWNKGIKGIFHQSEESIEKIRQAHLGMSYSDETKQKIREKAIGREISEATRLKMGLSQLGRKHSEATKLKMSLSQSGENNAMFGKKGMCGEANPMWNGGVSTEVMKIRNSIEFKSWRKAVYKRDNYTCQLCGYKGRGLNAHHIKLFSLYPELRFEVSNGITYCEDCHKNGGFHKEMPLRNYNRLAMAV